MNQGQIWPLDFRYCKKFLSLKQMALLFGMLIGIGTLLTLIAHYTVFLENLPVAVDKIIPRCFRSGCYGKCEYYRDFYTPTPQPFLLDVKPRLMEPILSSKRENFNRPRFPLSGMSLKQSGLTFKPNLDYSDVRCVPDFDESLVIPTQEKMAESV